MSEFFDLKLLVDNRAGFGGCSDGWMGVKAWLKGLLRAVQEWGKKNGDIESLVYFWGKLQAVCALLLLGSPSFEVA